MVRQLIVLWKSLLSRIFVKIILPYYVKQSTSVLIHILIVWVNYTKNVNEKTLYF